MSNSVWRLSKVWPLHIRVGYYLFENIGLGIAIVMIFLIPHPGWFTIGFLIGATGLAWASAVRRHVRREVIRAVRQRQVRLPR